MAEEKEKKFEGTGLGADAGKTVEQDVDALIQGALKELDTKKKDAPSKPLAGTELHKPPPPPKKEEEKQYDATFKKYKAGDIVEGTVQKVDNSGILLDIGYMSDALLQKGEYSGEPKVGEKIKVLIEKLESKEGYVLVSKNMADERLNWDLAFDAYRKKLLLEAKVIKAVRGGLLVSWKGINAFMPASQVVKKADEKLESFAGKNIPVKIIQIHRRQNKIVMSNRQAQGEKSKLDAQKIFDKLEVGQIVKGRVSNLKTFGAFVNLGGIEGLIHLSELSWKRVKHPSELLKTGQEIEVLVLGVDKANKKVALGLKELQADPWEKAAELYQPGQVIKIKVLRYVKFGVFVELDENLEGLVHISEISPQRFDRIEDAIKIGDVVDAKILRVIPEEQKIGLSIKQAAQDKEKARVDKELQKQQEENKVTIGDMIAEKERQREEAEEEGDTNEVSTDAPEGETKEQ